MSYPVRSYDDMVHRNLNIIKKMYEKNYSQEIIDQYAEYVREIDASSKDRTFFLNNEPFSKSNTVSPPSDNVTVLPNIVNVNHKTWFEMMNRCIEEDKICSLIEKGVDNIYDGRSGARSTNTYMVNMLNLRLISTPQGITDVHPFSASVLQDKANLNGTLITQLIYQNDLLINQYPSMEIYLVEPDTPAQPLNRKRRQTDLVNAVKILKSKILNNLTQIPKNNTINQQNGLVNFFPPQVDNDGSNSIKAKVDDAQKKKIGLLENLVNVLNKTSMHGIILTLNDMLAQYDKKNDNSESIKSDIERISSNMDGIRMKFSDVWPLLFTNGLELISYLKDKEYMQEVVNTHSDTTYNKEFKYLVNQYADNEIESTDIPFMLHKNTVGSFDGSLLVYKNETNLTNRLYRSGLKTEDMVYIVQTMLKFVYTRYHIAKYISLSLYFYCMIYKDIFFPKQKDSLVNIKSELYQYLSNMEKYDEKPTVPNLPFFKYDKDIKDMLSIANNTNVNTSGITIQQQKQQQQRYQVHQICHLPIFEFRKFWNTYLDKIMGYTKEDRKSIILHPNDIINYIAHIIKGIDKTDLIADQKSDIDSNVLAAYKSMQLTNRSSMALYHFLMNNKMSHIVHLEPYFRGRNLAMGIDLETNEIDDNTIIEELDKMTDIKIKQAKYDKGRIANTHLEMYLYSGNPIVKIIGDLMCLPSIVLNYMELDKYDVVDLNAPINVENIDKIKVVELLYNNTLLLPYYKRENKKKPIPEKFFYYFLHLEKQLARFGNLNQRTPLDTLGSGKRIIGEVSNTIFTSENVNKINDNATEYDKKVLGSLNDFYYSITCDTIYKTHKICYGEPTVNHYTGDTSNTSSESSQPRSKRFGNNVIHKIYHDTSLDGVTIAASSFLLSQLYPFMTKPVSIHNANDNESLKQHEVRLNYTKLGNKGRLKEVSKLLSGNGLNENISEEYNTEQINNQNHNWNNNIVEYTVDINQSIDGIQDSKTIAIRHDMNDYSELSTIKIYIDNYLLNTGIQPSSLDTSYLDNKKKVPEKELAEFLHQNNIINYAEVNTIKKEVPVIKKHTNINVKHDTVLSPYNLFNSNGMLYNPLDLYNMTSTGVFRSFVDIYNKSINMRINLYTVYISENNLESIRAKRTNPKSSSDFIKKINDFKTKVSHEFTLLVHNHMMNDNKLYDINIPIKQDDQQRPKGPQKCIFNVFSDTFGILSDENQNDTKWKNSKSGNGSSSSSAVSSNALNLKDINLAELKKIKEGDISSEVYNLHTDVVSQNIYKTAKLGFGEELKQNTPMLTPLAVIKNVLLSMTNGITDVPLKIPTDIEITIDIENFEEAPKIGFVYGFAEPDNKEMKNKFSIKQMYTKKTEEKKASDLISEVNSQDYVQKIISKIDELKSNAQKNIIGIKLSFIDLPEVPLSIISELTNIDLNPFIIAHSFFEKNSSDEYIFNSFMKEIVKEIASDDNNDDNDDDDDDDDDDGYEDAAGRSLEENDNESDE